MIAIYSFIAEEQADPDCDWSVTEMCRVLGVSRSGFYDWQDRPPSDREWATAARGRDRSDLGVLGPHLRRAEDASLAPPPGLPGRPQAGRPDHGQRLGRRVRPAPGADHRRRPGRDRGRGSGRPGLQPARPDRTWCGDITYLRTGEGWLFLATVIDLFSRRVIGWSVAAHMRTELVADALDMAVATRGGQVERRRVPHRPRVPNTPPPGSVRGANGSASPVDGRHRSVLGQRRGGELLRDAQA